MDREPTPDEALIFDSHRADQIGLEFYGLDVPKTAKFLKAARAMLASWHHPLIEP